MQLFAVVSATLALFTAASAAPTQLKTIEKYAGEVKPSSYIVKLKDGVSKDAHLAWLAENHGASATVTHPEWQEGFLNGFAGTFGSDALSALRASPDVELISEDGVVSIFATQTNAPWGLQRISQAAKLADQNTSDLTFTYTYDDSAGSGVDIYIVDTGIYTAHSEFGGRATWGATFGGYADADGHGHGTHVSGTAAGATYGVAKKAKLFAVKVLSDSGSGYVSDIVSGLNWVGQQAAASGRPSIASLSLGGGTSQTLDDAVTALTTQGVHVTVAAGNSNTDASTSSPARAPAVITVGASTIADARASFSNYGSVVDIFGPGQNVISSWIGGVNATNNISGTSMATPHIAGLVATIIARDGNASPADISTKIQTLSTKGALSSIPSGTVNDLARNES
ncbi:serine protease [Dichomitus squalens LYAD-421 SS1]|uniref:serine protease n=1 Tax=Dichomitus squalens (strain LYAD-421) TaxID=732165 RepID=UPI0004415A7F|nr:serine protease [Dichomitus squalens LYAD-421 SS1]EJF66736.1 serine protease [Dichomitus squalens LYAD-421 SS1]